MRTIALLALAVSAVAQPSSEADITTVVQSLFDAMKSHDADKARNLFATGATMTAIRPKAKPVNSTGDDFASRLATAKDAWLERMWEPKVMVHGDIAMLWAPYDFHLNGKFHHCGIDLVNLAKLEGVWKITSISYTSETEGCPASPLGPPR
jgi:hypothetical protein